MTQWPITLFAAAYGALANTKNQRCSDSSVEATNLMMIFTLLSLLSSYLYVLGILLKCFHLLIGSFLPFSF